MDYGQKWSRFSVIAMPQEGSAEAPGAMCISSNGDFIACYAPYNNFDIDVKKNLVICMYSTDMGLSWNSSEMLNFPYQDSNGAESWVVELSDGMLLSAT